MCEMESLKDMLRGVLTSQKFAVLSTHRAGQSHASLVAFAATTEMKELLFATARTTRKYTNLCENTQVALLIDNRSNRDADLREALAITATGRVEEAADAEREVFLARYLDKHPQLADFVNAPTSALMVVKIAKYELVRTFQNVVELHMTTSQPSQGSEP